MESEGQKPLEVPLPLERQEGASSRGDETTMMSVCGDPVTGKELESRCSSDIKFDAGMAFSGFTSPRCRGDSRCWFSGLWVGNGRE